MQGFSECHLVRSTGWAVHQQQTSWASTLHELIAGLTQTDGLVDSILPTRFGCSANMWLLATSKLNTIPLTDHIDRGYLGRASTLVPMKPIHRHDQASSCWNRPTALLQSTYTFGCPSDASACRANHCSDACSTCSFATVLLDRHVVWCGCPFA